MIEMRRRVQPAIGDRDSCGCKPRKSERRQMTDYEGRRSSLLALVEGDGFLVVNIEGSDGVSMFYLTGFTGEGALLLTNEEAVLLTDSRYTEQAAREVPRLAVEEVKGDYLEAVTKAVKKRNCETISYASRRFSHYGATKLQELLGKKLDTPEDPILELRIIKDREEISHIKDATRLTEESLEELLKQIKVGMRERDLALKLEMIMRRKGAQKVAFDLIVASGKNSALPHYQPGDRAIEEGDLLLFDIGARLDGYCSDMTRVFAVKKATQQGQDIYELVRRANEAGLNALKPGAKGLDVDRLARDVIDEGGHTEHFGHGLGHGVGLEVHEAPRLSQLSKDTLKEGMVVTVEPGVYLPEFGGVRIEDLATITEHGAEVLTNIPKDRLRTVG